MDAASSAADAGGLAATLDHGVAIAMSAAAPAQEVTALEARELTAAARENAAVETELATQALGLNATSTVSLHSYSQHQPQEFKYHNLLRTSS